MSRSLRVGLIVPSSNTTMETEVPELLRRREQIAPERFTFHSSRMAMRRVSAEELARMDAESNRCASELSDARCDVMAYACLIAIMAAGSHYHLKAQARLAGVAADNGGPASVVTSAGALVDGIHALGARRVALIAPYLAPLTQLVVDYLADCGIDVVDSISLGVADNLEVGRLDPMQLVDLAGRLRIQDADALVLSACVQMPSLPAIQIVEDRLGVPVLSASVATTYQILRSVGLDPYIPGAGSLLAESRLRAAA